MIGVYVTFDAEADVLAVSFRKVEPGEAVRTVELDGGRLVDYDAGGEALAVEFRQVSTVGVNLGDVPHADEIRTALQAFPAFAG